MPKPETSQIVKTPGDGPASYPTTSIPSTCLQAYLRRWRKKLRRHQNATLSENGFPMSDKRTMSDILLININNLIPSCSLLTNPNAARKDSHNANNDGSGEYH